MDSSLGNLAKERNKEAPLVLSKNGFDLFFCKERGTDCWSISLSPLIGISTAKNGTCFGKCKLNSS
jgi:hypothetical protein